MTAITAYVADAIRNIYNNVFIIFSNVGGLLYVCCSDILRNFNVYKINHKAKIKKNLKYEFQKVII